MSYKNLLESISKNIFSLESNHSELESIISNSENLSIYKRNLIGAILKSFKQDFPVTKKYLGSSNFIFFIRDFIQKRGIEKENIFQISQAFPTYLHSMSHIHGDDFLVYLATLDLFWNQFELQGIGFSVPKGLKNYWDHLDRDIETESLTVDFTKFESLKVLRLGEEKQLVLATS